MQPKPIISGRLLYASLGIAALMVGCLPCWANLSFTTSSFTAFIRLEILMDKVASGGCIVTLYVPPACLSGTFSVNLDFYAFHKKRQSSLTSTPAIFVLYCPQLLENVERGAHTSLDQRKSLVRVISVTVADLPFSFPHYPQLLAPHCGFVLFFYFIF
ncbi:UNVERIFIED_CONTAM: hypothetical protein K2H54_048639 [Gekko kuhli]